MSVNYKALAAELGIPRPNLYYYKKKAWWPKVETLENIKKAIEQNAAQQAKNVPTLEQARLDEIISRTELNKLKKLDLEGSMIPVTEVRDLFMRLGSGVKSVLYSQMENALPPKIEGRSIAEARKIMREAADAICEQLGKECEQWLSKRTKQ